MDNRNLFAALRAAFPQDLDGIAVETDTGLAYSWRDLDRGTAMIANLLQSLNIAPGARIAVQVEKSVEALMLYLATLRAGYAFLPLNTAYQKAEIEYFVGNAEPAVVVCSPANFGWVSKIAFQAGTHHVGRWLPGDVHADGPRGLPGVGQAVAWHGRHARLVRVEQRHA